MSTTVLDTFVTRFGYKTDTKGLDKAKKGLGDFKASALKVGAAIGAIIGGGFFLSKIAETADTTLKFADSVGVAVEMVDALGFAAKRQGGTVGGLRSSLEKINKTIGEVQRGQGMAKIAFEDYGLTVQKANGQIKTADELFLELNKKFANLSKAQQFDLAKKMGIDTGTIKLLQTAPEAVHDLMSEARSLGVLTRKDAEAAAEFQDGLTNISQALNAIKFAVGGVLFKPLAAFFKLIAKGTAFIRKHSRFIKILAVVIGLLILPFVALKIAAAAAWLATFAPIIAIVAGIALLATAIALLVDDFIAFFKGQDSFIGDLVKKWGWLGIAIQDAIIGAIDKSVQKIKDFIAMVKFILIDFGQDFINLGEIIWDSIKIPKAFTWLMDKAGFQSPQPAPTQSSQTTTNSSANNITVKSINIDAKGGDSKEIAQNVGAALKSQLQNTVQDFDSGIKK